MSTTLITSRDSQGRHIVGLFETMLDKKGIPAGERAQYLVEKGGLLQEGWNAVIDRVLAGFPLRCDQAQEILGKNFFGPEDYRNLGVTLTTEQLEQVGKFPWSDTILNGPCPFHSKMKVKETHFAFLGLDKSGEDPLSIRRFQDLFPASGQPRFYSYDDAWYREQEFANKPTCRLRWYLMLKDIVPNSENKTFSDQQRMLPAAYEVPEAVEDVAKHLLCRQKTGKDVNRNRYGRTNTLDLDSNRVYVGVCDARGLVVSSYSDSGCIGSLGLSASRKLGV